LRTCVDAPADRRLLQRTASIKQQGGAAEFVDYREYVEGEDLRRLDWKV